MTPRRRWGTLTDASAMMVVHRYSGANLLLISLWSTKLKLDQITKYAGHNAVNGGARRNAAPLNLKISAVRVIIL